MVYFITMQEMPNAPKTDIPNVLFYPVDGLLHFAIEYTLFPSSKGLKYKIFIMHVDKNGNAQPETPLYGLNADTPTIFSTDSVKKVASSIQMIIAITCKRWYKYFEHSPAGIEYADVARLGGLFENYLRFVPVNIQALEFIFFGKFGSYPSDIVLKAGGVFPNRDTVAKTNINTEVEIQQDSGTLSSVTFPGPYFVPPPPIPSDKQIQLPCGSQSSGSTQLSQQDFQPAAKIQKVLHSTPTTMLYHQLDRSDFCAVETTQSVSGCDGCYFEETSFEGIFDDI